MKYVLILVLLIIAVLSFSSCSKNQNMVEEIDLPDMENETFPDGVDADNKDTDNKDENKTLDNSETITIEQGGFTYEIPADWEQVDEMSSDQVLFFKPIIKSIEEKPSNVTVEMSENGRKSPTFEELSESNIFDESMVGGIARRAEDIKIGESFFVPIGGVFQASYYYSLENGGRIMQRMYLPVVDYYAVLVYATDFEDGTTPSAEDVAMLILNTMKYSN